MAAGTHQKLVQALPVCCLWMPLQLQWSLQGLALLGAWRPARPREALKGAHGPVCLVAQDLVHSWCLVAAHLQSAGSTQDQTEGITDVQTTDVLHDLPQQMHETPVEPGWVCTILQ